MRRPGRCIEHNKAVSRILYFRPPLRDRRCRRGAPRTSCFPVYAPLVEAVRDAWRSSAAPHRRRGQAATLHVGTKVLMEPASLGIAPCSVSTFWSARGPMAMLQVHRRPATARACAPRPNRRRLFVSDPVPPATSIGVAEHAEHADAEQEQCGRFRNRRREAQTQVQVRG